MFFVEDTRTKNKNKMALKKAKSMGFKKNHQSIYRFQNFLY